MFQTYKYDVVEYQYSQGYEDYTEAEAKADPAAAACLAAGRQKWVVTQPMDKLKADLDIRGPQGWELVQLILATDRVTAVFKQTQFAWAFQQGGAQQGGLYGPKGTEIPFQQYPYVSPVCSCGQPDGTHQIGCPCYTVFVPAFKVGP